MKTKVFNSDSLDEIGLCLYQINDAYDRLHRCLWEGKETDIVLDVDNMYENTKRMISLLNSLEVSVAHSS